MISNKMQDAFNEQINKEMYSAYLYLSMSAWCASQNLNGFSSWFKNQYQEEMVHAMKMYNYVEERGGRITLKQIDAPVNEWSSPLNVFEETYKHEQKVTGLINNLVMIAEEEKDKASEIFLQWFVTEQVEEESTADEVVNKIKLMKDAPGGMFMLDQELGKRVFIVPPGGIMNPGAGE